MRPHHKLHEGIERLIGTALVDATVRRTLLRDPRRAALEFGLAAADAAIVADIHATDLRTFAQALLPRLYGETAYATISRPAVG